MENPIKCIILGVHLFLVQHSPGKPRNSYHFFRQRDLAGFRGFKLRVKLTSQLVFQVYSKMSISKRFLGHFFFGTQQQSIEGCVNLNL